MGGMAAREVIRHEDGMYRGINISYREEEHGGLMKKAS